MGKRDRLFDKLFGKENPEKQTAIAAANPAHRKEWEFYFCNIDGKFGSIFVDLGLLKFAPMPDKPHVVWVSIKMTKPTENGMSSQAESGVLGDIENALADKIDARHNSIYVGRTTSAGYRDLYFYFGDTTLYDKTISEAMVAWPEYRFEFGTEQDKEWSGYIDFLYPRPQQLQNIQNRRVIEQLEKNGDNLTKPREVDHWIFFKKETERDEFLQRISADGFSIVVADYDKEALGETPYRLQIKRIDRVDQNSVDEYVIYLWNIANETNGEYDGWETSVEAD